MGIGNDLIVEDLKKNQEEIARKQAAGEKLSAGNWFKLIIQIGFGIISIIVSILIIGLCLSLL